MPDYRACKRCGSTFYQIPFDRDGGPNSEGTEIWRLVCACGSTHEIVAVGVLHHLIENYREALDRIIRISADPDVADIAERAIGRADNQTRSPLRQQMRVVPP